MIIVIFPIATSLSCPLNSMFHKKYIQWFKNKLKHFPQLVLSHLFTVYLYVLMVTIQYTIKQSTNIFGLPHS